MSKSTRKTTHRSDKRKSRVYFEDSGRKLPDGRKLWRPTPAFAELPQAKREALSAAIAADGGAVLYELKADDSSLGQRGRRAMTQEIRQAPTRIALQADDYCLRYERPEDKNITRLAAKFFYPLVKAHRETGTPGKPREVHWRACCEHLRACGVRVPDEPEKAWLERWIAPAWERAVAELDAKVFRKRGPNRPRR